MWHWNDWPGGAAWVWMTLMMVVVWTPLLLALLWWLRSPGGARSTPPDVDASDIARRAYARGELSRERFREIMGDLAEHPGADDRDRHEGRKENGAGATPTRASAR